MRTQIVFTLLAASLVAAPAVHASTIVYTGDPISSSGPTLRGGATFQWLAAEFVTTQSWEVTSLEGWINPSDTGDVGFALYTDGGDVPGTSLFSQTIGIPGTGATTWYGPTGLSWFLPGPGTYWVVFGVPSSSSFVGFMPSPSPSPLINEAFSTNFGASWTGVDSIDVGVRILGNDAASAAVPEPASLVLLGTGLIGAGVRRYRQRRRNQ